MIWLGSAPSAIADDSRANALVSAPGTVQLEPCRLTGANARRAVRGQCGTLDVPLDYDQPNGPGITLSVAWVPALKKNKVHDVAITVIAGGPGQASMEFYAAYNQAFHRMREEFDIILVDQRGTGDSNRLSCTMPEQTLGGLWTAQQTSTATKQCLEQLTVDTRYFTTSVAVQDLDAVRAALGYNQLSVYGISYGTRVAQHYLRRYPTHTHSVILDGVVPVDEALGPDIPLLAEQAMQMAFIRCRTDAACNDVFPDLAARFDAMMGALRREPVQVTLNNPITARIETITVRPVGSGGRDSLAVLCTTDRFATATHDLRSIQRQLCATGRTSPDDNSPIGRFDGLRHAQRGGVRRGRARFILTMPPGVWSKPIWARKSLRVCRPSAKCGRAE